MRKTLVILEVSRKQDYIFGVKGLDENVRRSRDIAYVTGGMGGAFFARATGGGYREEEHLIYAGGGHTVLWFDTREEAVAFVRAVTYAAMAEYGGLELFAATLDVDTEETAPKEALSALTARLEGKKARRAAAFHRQSFGMEKLDENYLPLRLDLPPKSEAGTYPDLVPPPAGYTFAGDAEAIAGGEDNFIAIVHADGNAMGRRVENIYGKGNRWETAPGILRRFSESIQADFEGAFRRAAEVLIPLATTDRVLPIRPIILAGDDLCFVTRGDLGLECARLLLEELTRRTNPEDGLSYAACAGVALVHTKFPFHRAYSLSEQLCSRAKRFGAQLDGAAGTVSAMDWHIEFGEMKDDLDAIREDYTAQDGSWMELRPVAVAGTDKAGRRTYRFFRQLCEAFQQPTDRAIARSKLKPIRGYIKEGAVETRYYLEHSRMLEAFERLPGLSGGTFFEKAEDGRDRCLIFDAIEMTDHCRFYHDGNWDGRRDAT